MTDQIARNEKQLGAILRRARKNAGLTQGSLGKSAGMGQGKRTVRKSHPLGPTKVACSTAGGIQTAWAGNTTHVRVEMIWVQDPERA